MTIKAHTYYIIFGRSPMGGSFPLPSPGGATDSHIIEPVCVAVTASFANFDFLIPVDASCGEECSDRESV